MGVFVYLALLWFMGCQGCSSCTPSVPPPLKTDTGHSGRTDTSPTDSVFDSEDTGPEPPCAQPEEEPNGIVSEANEIELERWACGTFTEGLDLDYYRFEVETTDWIKVVVNAASMGSAADPMLYLESDEEDSFDINNSEDSTDPWVLFPLWEADGWTAMLMDSFGGSGEDYFYEMLVSIAKPPVIWNAEESEEEGGPDEGPRNDMLSQAMDLEEGMVVFGRTGHSKDLDWYRIVTPAGKAQTTVRVQAFQHGSPLNSKLLLYDIDGNEIDKVTSGETSYDRDPVMIRTTESSEEWYVVVRSEGSEGLAHWYVIDVSFEEAE